MVSPLRRNVLWLLSTLTVLVLLFGYHTSTEGKAGGGSAIIGAAAGGEEATATATDGASSDTSSETSAGSSSGTSDAPSSQAAATSTVTGDEAQTQWGPVQVRLTMTGSRITGVDVIEYPDGNGRDAEINAYALPRLVQETLSAQSADIDMISGATVTSDGYLQSLQSALDKA
jgi:uncharacterized protein with FMN-binding domain